MKMRTKLSLLVALAALAMLVGRTVRAEQPALDIDGLGRNPYGRMYMLLEKTFLNIDVLTVEMRFGPETADALRGLAQGHKLTSELIDSIATRAYRAEDAYVEIRFKRGVSLDDFVDAVRTNLERARKANMIDEANFQNVSRNLPRWFGFLEERGIKSGDRILYRARPSSMRTIYVERDGKVDLDQTDQGSAPRLALLGGYFAPGSDFRKGLVESLFRPR
jgi:hypothetical protein